MTWKIVKVSKASVLYIYIDNNNNQSLQYSKLFTFISFKFQALYFYVI